MKRSSLILVASTTLLGISLGPETTSAVAVTAPQSCQAGFNMTPVQVPAGMDPLSATNDQLDAANLPSRPTDTDDPNYDIELKAWTNFVTNPIKTWSCSDVTTTIDPDQSLGGAAPLGLGSDESPSTLANGSLLGSKGTANWGGFEVGHLYYRRAEATWVTPWTETDDNHPTAHQSMWVGLGQGSSEGDPLVQAGTANAGDTTNFESPVIWWEVYCSCPGGNSQQTISYVAQGDVIYVKVVTSGTSPTDTFTITDETSGYGTTFSTTKMSANYSGTTAEWISERPTFSNYLTPLAKTVDLPHSYDTFSGAKAKAPSNSDFEPISYFDRWRIHMTNCANDTTLQTTSLLNSAGDSFDTTWQTYGQRETC